MGEFNWEERLKAEYAELKKRYEKLRAHNIRLEVKINLAQTKISLSYHTTKMVLRKNLCKIENCDKNDITGATVKSRSNFLQYTTDTVICQDTSAISRACRDT